MEGKATRFERIVGGTDEEVELAHQKVDANLNLSREEFAARRVELSESEREFVTTVGSSVNEVMQRYGGNPPPIAESNIYVVPPGGASELSNGRFDHGFCNPVGQYSVVDKSPSNVAWARSLAHELCHLQAYGALQIVEGDAVPYRLGISSYDRTGTKRYLHDLEEAIVAKLTDIVVEQELRHHPDLEKELTDRETVRTWLKKFFDLHQVPLERQINSLATFNVVEMASLADFLNSDVSSESPETYKLGGLAGRLAAYQEQNKLKGNERQREREKLEEIISDVLNKLPDRFTDREAVFELFARAHCNGDLLPLAKVIEETYGKGSFRKIAEETKRIIIQ
ncbi:MAG: hypothetical protein KBB55_03630 [Candidatus Buchananbacteria bacterium]|nr:hypothetical protein [Candidatus Buchananbacteria bacterium]